MRLVLSRKGFDSSAGGRPSPIFRDGSLVSLPIPEKHSLRTYDQVRFGDRSLGVIAEELTRGRIRREFGVHLDPDLEAGAVERAPGWRPSLGQCNAAQTVLSRAGVGVGDLFLFFGWFREVTEDRPGHLAYKRGTPDLHVLFGWLQVGEVIHPPDDPAPPWAADHPHVTHQRRKNNTMYLASDRVTLPGARPDLPGAGVFPELRDDLILTASGAKRSTWALPQWLDPRDGRPPLGGHHRLDRWTTVNGGLHLASVRRGQEFVLDLEHYPEASEWLLAILSAGKAPADRSHRVR